MKLYLYIPFNNIIYEFGFLNGENYSNIFLKDFCSIDVFKYHNHSYFVKGFFYNSRRIFFDYKNTKSKLYDSVQSFLQEELLYVEQFC